MRTNNSSRHPLPIALLLLTTLLPLCTAYPTSFESIQSLPTTTPASTLSPDGSWFATGNLQNSTDLWSTSTFTIGFTLGPHNSDVTCISINSDNSLVVTGSTDETAKIWRFNNETQKYDEAQLLNDSDASVSVVVFSNNASLVLLGSDAGEVLVYAYQTDKFQVMQTIVGFDRITAVAIDAKSEQVFVAGAGNSSKVLRWDDGTMQYVETTETFPEEVNSAVWNDAGDRLYLAHGNGVDMFVYNNDTKVYELQGTLADHTNTVRSLAISSNSSWLSSAGDDQTVLIYQWNGTEYKKFSTQTSDSAILQISTSSDGSLLSSTTSTTSTFFQYGIDCSNDPYSHGTRSSPTTCSCKDRFYWSPKFQACSINCDNDKFSSKTQQQEFNTCNCIDSFVWDLPQLRCQIPCGDDPNSQGANIEADVCSCNDDFVWNGEKYRCYFDCSKVEDSDGNYNATVCNCVEMYLWRDMKCWIDCTQISNSNGTNSGINECFCNDNYKWDTKVRLCTYWQNCSQDPHSTGQNIDAFTCICKSHFEWSTGDKLCSVNCKSDRNSNGSIDAQTCSCRQHFTWNTDFFLCSVDCNSDPNSNHTNINPTSCYCNKNYLWSSAMGECVFWFSCQNDPNSNGINHDNVSCECNPNFAWSARSNECTIQCQSDPNSSGQPASVTSCYCNSGYEWDEAVKSCKGTGGNTTVIIIMAVVIGVLVLLVAFLVVRQVKMRKQMNASMVRGEEERLMD